MRRLFVALLLAAVPAAAATHTQIQTAADSFWTTHNAKFTAVQINYAAGHNGRFWQGIRSHATCPDDGALVNPTLTSRPTDQIERWTDMFAGGRALPSTNWPVCLAVDVYEGPRGNGWSVTVAYTKGGETWARTYHFGPETRRERGWARVQ
jgi:hypothetical protein